MKKKLIIFSTIFLLFTLFIVVKFFILDASKPGILRVLSTPTATIFLNGNTIGRTSYDAEQKEGEYQIKLIPENVATETASWSDKIIIFKGTATVIRVDLGKSSFDTSVQIFYVIKSENKNLKDNEGEIEVEVEPAGSTIQIDRDEKGISPSLITPVARGEHELTVSSPGFFPRTEKINIEAGYKTVAKIKLAINQDYKNMDTLRQEFNEKTASESAAASAEAILSTPSAKIIPLTNISPTPISKTLGKTYIIISDTPTGFLRVRSEPSVSASESAQVNPQSRFEVIEENSGWYKIMYEKDKYGWVYSQYADKEN
jgi:hypothetical protein